MHSRPGGTLSGEKEQKPAGQPADFRSIAAMCSLRELVGNDFRGLSQCWLGMLMQESLVFRDKTSKKVYCSLGHTIQLVLLWEMTPAAETCLLYVAILVTLDA